MDGLAFSWLHHPVRAFWRRPGVAFLAAVFLLLQAAAAQGAPVVKSPVKPTAPVSPVPPKMPAAALKATGAAAGPGSGSQDEDPPVTRTVIHTEAYDKRAELGPHLDIKVTPPEKRGRKGRVLVELYNYSKNDITLADFWITLSNDWGDKAKAHVRADDIKAGWSALKWIKVPGAGKLPEGKKELPKYTRVEASKMQLFGAHGRNLPLKFFVDLIKE